jgi:hypothetical protein
MIYPAATNSRCSWSPFRPPHSRRCLPRRWPIDPAQLRPTITHTTRKREKREGGREGGRMSEPVPARWQSGMNFPSRFLFSRTLSPSLPPCNSACIVSTKCHIPAVLAKGSQRNKTPSCAPFPYEQFTPLCSREPTCTPVAHNTRKYSQADATPWRGGAHQQHCCIHQQHVLYSFIECANPAPHRGASLRVLGSGLVLMLWVLRPKARSYRGGSGLQQ